MHEQSLRLYTLGSEIFRRQIHWLDLVSQMSAYIRCHSVPLSAGKIRAGSSLVSPLRLDLIP